MDDEIWEGWERYYIWLVSYEFFKKTWVENPVNGYTSSFTDYMNNAVLHKIKDETE